MGKSSLSTNVVTFQGGEGGRGGGLRGAVGRGMGVTSSILSTNSTNVLQCPL